MAAVELLSAALAAEDVTEKTEKLQELKQQLDADADGAIAATLDAELPALVGLLSGEAAVPALGVATALARWTHSSNSLLEHGAVPVLVQLLTPTETPPPPPAEGEEAAAEPPAEPELIYPTPSLAQRGCAALGAVATHPEGRLELAAAGAVAALVALLAPRYDDQAAVQSEAMLVLSHCAGEAACREQAREHVAPLLRLLAPLLDAAAKPPPAGGEAVAAVELRSRLLLCVGLLAYDSQLKKSLLDAGALPILVQALRLPLTPPAAEAADAAADDDE